MSVMRIDLKMRTGRSKEALSKEMTTIDQAYRAALMSLEPNSALLGQVTDQEFQSLVDDLLDLFAREISRKKGRGVKGAEDWLISEQARVASGGPSRAEQTMVAARSPVCRKSGI